MSNSEEKINNQKRNNKKAIKISLITIIFILILVGTIVFFINKIPFKYYGTYVHYYYFNGKEFKSTYKISPLSIKLVDLDIDGEPKEIKFKYSKKGEDIIIKYEGEEQYLILEDDCLYTETSKDISLSKKYGSFYWNEKSDKADLYEINSKADEYGNLLEQVVNSWSRELIYKSIDTEIKNKNFYILNSDEESDTTDLNSYKVILKAANGKLNLYFDRKNKKLERIYFSGTVSNSLYGGASKDTMDFEDIYDSRALLLASMFLLNNIDELNLSYNLDSIEELTRKSSAVMNYDALFINKTTDEENEKKYYFYGTTYDASFHSLLYNSYYSLSGVISWSIDLK